MPTLALLSDIHGNLPALEAVLVDLDAHSPDAVYVLGDMVNGCPWSADVLDLIEARGWPMLLGNHDDAVLQLGTPRMEARYTDRKRFGALWWTRERLSSHQVTLLESLPLEQTAHIPGAAPVRLVHGVPGNFFWGFHEGDDTHWGVRRLAGVSEHTVAAGHTHIALVRHYGPWFVVNPGSVGAPYDGDARASYMLLHYSNHGHDEPGWQTEIRRLPYDLAVVEHAFHDSGLLDEAGVAAEMFLRSVLTGQPWVADFFWWIREQPAEMLKDIRAALRLYEARYGPGRWAFPHA